MLLVDGHHATYRNGHQLFPGSAASYKKHFQPGCAGKGAGLREKMIINKCCQLDCETKQHTNVITRLL